LASWDILSCLLGSFIEEQRDAMNNIPKIGTGTIIRRAALTLPMLARENVDYDIFR